VRKWGSVKPSEGVKFGSFSEGNLHQGSRIFAQKGKLADEMRTIFQSNAQIFGEEERRELDF
jgi:hypothetical protein